MITCHAGNTPYVTSSLTELLKEMGHVTHIIYLYILYCYIIYHIIWLITVIRFHFLVCFCFQTKWQKPCHKGLFTQQDTIRLFYLSMKDEVVRPIATWSGMVRLSFIDMSWPVFFFVCLFIRHVKRKITYLQNERNDKIVIIHILNSFSFRKILFEY